MNKFHSLRKFYQEEYRPLYDRFVNEGAVAQELHAEIAAAFDHLMRYAENGCENVPEEQIDKIIGHIKRGTFDAFKLIFANDIRRAYECLSDRRFADVHDGEFPAEINQLWNNALQLADDARRLESLSGGIYSDNWNAAFDAWKKILPIADEFQLMLASSEITKAKMRAGRRTLYSILDKTFWLLLGTLLSWLAARFF